MAEQPTPQQDTDDTPPILGSWQALYTLVILVHFVLIGLFYWFTCSYD